MKKGFSIIFVIVLICLICALGFFTYRLFFDEEKILVPDFSKSNVDEVIEWCQNQENNPCTFENEYSDTVVENGIIYQSISANEELGDNHISIVVSLGKKFELNTPIVDDKTNREVIEKWKQDNNVSNPIEYIDEYSDTVEKGFVTRIEPKVVSNKDETINVYISQGIDPSKIPEETEIEFGDYFDISEEKFIENMKTLGLKPNHKESKDAYSSTVKKGNIVWHGSGTYEKDETINYGLSKGKDEGNEIEIKAEDYVGKTLDEFKKAVKQLGLVPEHSEDRDDDYSDKIKKGSILWHGSGIYVKDEVIHYTLSLGSKDGDSDIIVIKEKEYVGKTEDEFKKIAEGLGLVPLHNKDWDAYSDTVAKGKIVRHGYTEYEKGENFRYGLSLGKQGQDSEDIVIKANTYVGKTLDEFKKAVKELGLVPEHSEAREDAYSDTVAKGSILWHGSGTYELNEAIHYTVSLGKAEKVTIAKNSYKDYTESKFKSTIKELGLTTSHDTDKDDYSSSIAKGNIIYHSYGTLNKGDTVTYGLSLGEAPKTVSITKSKYKGLSKDDFVSTISGLGLVANHDSSKDEYSSTVDEGVVIWHNSGTFYIGDSLDYGLSLGTQKTDVLSFDDLSNYERSSYEDTKTAIKSYFVDTCGFSSKKVTISGEKSTYAAGIILSVSINGEALTSGGKYPIDSSVSVVISSGYNE